VGVQSVLAVGSVGLQHDPHPVRGGERRVGPALFRELRFQAKKRRLGLDDLRPHLGAQIFRAFGDGRGSFGRHGDLLQRDGEGWSSTSRFSFCQ
jgi:hypothetical protein